MPLSGKSNENEVISATSWNDDLLKDPHAVADKRRRVQKMFAAIAPSYDLNNRLHSLWMDQRWRKKAVKLAELKSTDAVLDVACGTGDLAFRFAEGLFGLFNRSRRSAPLLHRPPTVLGIDFTFEMLPLARDKGSWFKWSDVDPPSPELPNGALSLWGYQPNRWINGDAQSLPLSDQTADIVSIAFGIRNVQDPAKALSEFRRVLRPGGRLIILEFSLPTNPILRSLYNFYFRQVLPRTATLISGDKTGAYKYLPESVNTFIGREKMMEMMAAAGFEQIEQFPMTFGVCVCYRGVVSG
jgi:demethylmenaquinone methyltransferase/2-methoxy-6-polyprenyl-1,4-benzoquinol methylase